MLQLSRKITAIIPACLFKLSQMKPPMQNEKILNVEETGCWVSTFRLRKKQGVTMVYNVVLCVVSRSVSRKKNKNKTKRLQRRKMRRAMEKITDVEI